MSQLDGAGDRSAACAMLTAPVAALASIATPPLPVMSLELTMPLPAANATLAR